LLPETIIGVVDIQADTGESFSTPALYNTNREKIQSLLMFSYVDIDGTSFGEALVLY
jgi:hypothetical protein